MLLNHYLETFSNENNKQINGFTPEAYEVLSKYSWPGNIRELRNLSERMVVLCQNNIIDVSDIPSHIRLPKEKNSIIIENENLTVNEMEKEMIIQALEKNSGNRTQAAESLGMSRRTLHRKLNKLGLTRKILDVKDEKELD